jgi:ATP-dependent helicase/nuclease subunit A
VGSHNPEPNPPPPDTSARLRALDITQSFLIEAPAGSGKTALLIQRYLKLLAAVEDPTQVLAITFTRKATAELLTRVFNHLAEAAADTHPRPGIDAATRPLALAVLAHDARLGWNLLDHPDRFNIRTIDGLCAQIAASRPLLSGAAAAATDDPAPLYAEAARRTLLQLGGSDRPLHLALETLLLHRDGNLANCESLLANMLAWRDQWGELVPLTPTALNDQYLDDHVLPALDRALDLAICRALTRLERVLPPAILRQLTLLAAEMGELDGYKGAPSPISICAGRRQSPAARTAHLEHWRALVHLIIKPSKPRNWRKSLSGNHIGFEILKHHQADLKQIIADLAELDGAFEALCSIENLPPAQYPRENWPVTKALFRVLARALLDLKLLFAERGQSDFTEIALLARDALRANNALEDLASATNLNLQHLLVDEMQDTSSGQYEFLQLLTQDWNGTDQTLFLVGDPKQSIYLFRQARVERFVQTLTSARFGTGLRAIPLEVLSLTANFRSAPDLVRAFNDDFAQIFPSTPDPLHPELVHFQPAIATQIDGPLGPGSRTWHTAFLPYQSTLEASTQQSADHASEIRDLIAARLATPLPPGRPVLHGSPEPWKIAILVSNRNHLTPILAALERTPAIPYRAIKIKTLAERPEILDLLALTRALLHPADRTAWLALLRSPACGLSLADLHRLAGSGQEIHARSTIPQLFHTLAHDLSDDGIARLQPVFLTLTDALAQRGQLPLSQWVQRTWHALRIPTYSTAEALTNAESYFQLLDELAAQAEPGALLSLPHLQSKMEKLYAAPATTPGAVDILTIHGAKGLEWDLVIVPEVHRKGRSNTGGLLQWLESPAQDLANQDLANQDLANQDLANEAPAEGPIAAGIFAPIAPKGSSAGTLSQWMRSIVSARESAERRRLFYVVCTRAKQELHLFAAPKLKKDNTPTIASGSLLEAAWPAPAPFFEVTPASQPLAEVIPFPQPQLLSLAAAAAPPPPRLIQRIPQISGAPSRSAPSNEVGSHTPYPRPEGSFTARAFGATLHTFLELLAKTPDPDPTTWQPRIAAVLRASGLPPSEIPRQTAEVLRGLTQTLADPIGRWLLAPHPEAASESTIATPEATIRLDRTFLAGPDPLSTGTTHLWIVDFKTSTQLAAEQEKYGPQLETYAELLATKKSGNLRLGLYYPLIPRLIWWPAAINPPLPK